MQGKITKTALAAVLLTVIMAMAPARLGPPWISIEYPPSPFDRTTRDAFLLVHAFHHGTPMNFPVAGKAEGVVNGERRSIKLDFTTTSRQGVYALRKQWPAEGNWVLDLTPKQPLPTLTRLILSLDPKNWEIKKAVVHDQFENTVTMRFTKMAVNSGLPDRTFTFVAPKGVVIVPFK